ncbi:MAG: hypothetical protein ACPGNT_06945 [Rhodospirillales bacterium]
MTEDNARARQRFAMAYDRELMAINKKVLDPLFPHLTLGHIRPILATVARVRGRYLREAFRLTQGSEDGLPTPDEVKKLRELREAYEEAMAVAEALDHAIERGYITVTDL